MSKNCENEKSYARRQNEIEDLQGVPVELKHFVNQLKSCFFGLKPFPLQNVVVVVIVDFPMVLFNSVFVEGISVVVLVSVDLFFTQWTSRR